MSQSLDYLRALGAFPFALRRFMGTAPLTVEEARRVVRERMAHREANFLALVERSVYGWPRSPYLALLRAAGCELGDLRALVQSRGLEGALAQLREAGVYVTFEEFKGRKPIQRNGVNLAVRPGDFDNPTASRHLAVKTGGSTGAGQSIGVNLEHMAALAPHRLLILAAHGLVGAPTSIWQGPLPAPGLSLLLFCAYTGMLPRHWYSHVGPRDSRQWLKYGLATYYLLAWMRLLGVPAPLPETVRVDEAIVIARWAVETVRAQGRCVIRCGVSRGVRLGLAAQAAGLDLTGVTITGGGEPPTPAKVRQMTDAGAHYIPNYGMLDAGQVGGGCARPNEVSDVHLYRDSLALITYPHRIEAFDATVPAFNFTTLLPTAPKVMLNAQMDDYGVVEERSCGCELESLGYSTHVREVRSYAKLTGEGVTLIGTELIRLLEEVLPARFGGSPQDYQLSEEEDEQGLTRLYLLVHPRVTVRDEQALVQCVLDGLGKSSPMADVARLVWQNSQTLRVRRAAPIWTGRGKLLPLHVSRRAAERSLTTGGE